MNPIALAVVISSSSSSEVPSLDQLFYQRKALPSEAMLQHRHESGVVTARGEVLCVGVFRGRAGFEEEDGWVGGMLFCEGVF